MSRPIKKQIFLGETLFFLLCFLCYSSSSQKNCPNCGLLKVPYPLSTNPDCGDTDYTLRCDTRSRKLYFDALNGSSYPVLKIKPKTQKIVIQTLPWLPNTCTTQDFAVSEGLWLNQTLPFNISSSNTVFIFNCSPRLFVSPLNCTPSSLCHRYLQSSGRVDPSRALQCASAINPCCTFIAGGLPSAYKIRLHASGCRAFRSIIDLDKEKPASLWEGVEIQWAPPPEPVCKTQLQCSAASKCLPAGKKGISRCLCNKHYNWDPVVGVCLKQRHNSKSGLTIKISIGVASFFAVVVLMTCITVRKSRKIHRKAKVAKEREELFKSKSGMRSARMFTLKELKKATNGFSKDRILGVGGFGEVYKGELRDGTVVAVKSAKVGNIKSTQQVLNEVGILSQVNHKNLVRLLGCCVEAEQPLMINEYISRGTLHHHLHGDSSVFLNWKLRLQISLQTAEALAYLHTAAHTPIYHRDIKSTNILLDDDFNAKISDFGLSRLAQPGLSHVSTCAQGTLGYLDPEYYRNYPEYLDPEYYRNYQFRLLGPWWWRFHSGEDALWIRVIKSIFGDKGGLGLVSSSSSMILKSPCVWKGVIKAGNQIGNFGEDFVGSFRKKIGDGSSTKFWTDPWIGNGPLRDHFPRLWRLEKVKEAKVIDRVFQAETGVQHSWDWERMPRGRATGDLQTLQNLISSYPFDWGIPDKWLWSLSNDGDFAVKYLEKSVSLFGSFEIKVFLYWRKSTTEVLK